MAETKHTPGPSKIMAIEIERQYADWEKESQQGYTASLDTKLRVITALIERHTSVGRTRLEAEKAELVKTAQTLLNQFEKWEGYHQWDEEDENALKDAQAVLAKVEPK